MTRPFSIALIAASLFANTAMAANADPQLATPLPRTAPLVVPFDAPAVAHTTLQALDQELQVGDLVFIRIDALPFRKVALATMSWTNHVGVVVETGAAGAVIAESALPRSRRTPLAKFVARSADGRVAVERLNAPLSDSQRIAIARAADARLGRFYDTGFDLRSKHREFCSRFAREVLIEATGVEVGETETFERLLQRNPAAGLGFWRVWFAGSIPWSRETVTPASQLRSPLVHAVFDGRVIATPT